MPASTASTCRIRWAWRDQGTVKVDKKLGLKRVHHQTVSCQVISCSSNTSAAASVADDHATTHNNQTTTTIDERIFQVGDAITILSGNDRWFAHLIDMFEDRSFFNPEDPDSCDHMRCSLRWFYASHDVEWREMKAMNSVKDQKNIIFSDHVDQGINPIHCIFGLTWVFPSIYEACAFYHRRESCKRFVKGKDIIRVVDSYFNSECTDTYPLRSANLRELVRGELDYLLRNPCATAMYGGSPIYRQYVLRCTVRKTVGDRNPLAGRAGNAKHGIPLSIHLDVDEHHDEGYPQEYLRFPVQQLTQPEEYVAQHKENSTSINDRPANLDKENNGIMNELLSIDSRTAALKTSPSVQNGSSSGDSTQQNLYILQHPPSAVPETSSALKQHPISTPIQPLQPLPIHEEPRPEELTGSSGSTTPEPRPLISTFKPIPKTPGTTAPLQATERPTLAAAKPSTNNPSASDSLKALPTIAKRGKSKGALKSTNTTTPQADRTVKQEARITANRKRVATSHPSLCRNDMVQMTFEASSKTPQLSAPTTPTVSPTKSPKKSPIRSPTKSLAKSPVISTGLRRSTGMVQTTLSPVKAAAAKASRDRRMSPAKSTPLPRLGLGSAFKPMIQTKLVAKNTATQSTISPLQARARTSSQAPQIAAKQEPVLSSSASHHPIQTKQSPPTIQTETPSVKIETTILKPPVAPSINQPTSKPKAASKAAVPLKATITPSTAISAATSTAVLAGAAAKPIASSATTNRTPISASSRPTQPTPKPVTTALPTSSIKQSTPSTVVTKRPEERQDQPTSGIANREADDNRKLTHARHPKNAQIQHSHVSQPVVPSRQPEVAARTIAPPNQKTKFVVSLGPVSPPCSAPQPLRRTARKSTTMVPPSAAASSPSLKVNSKPAEQALSRKTVSTPISAVPVPNPTTKFVSKSGPNPLPFASQCHSPSARKPPNSPQASTAPTPSTSMRGNAKPVADHAAALVSKPPQKRGRGRPKGSNSKQPTATASAKARTPSLTSTHSSANEDLDLDEEEDEPTSHNYPSSRRNSIKPFRSRLQVRTNTHSKISGPRARSAQFPRVNNTPGIVGSSNNITCDNGGSSSASLDMGMFAELRAASTALEISRQNVLRSQDVAADASIRHITPVKQIPRAKAAPVSTLVSADVSVSGAEARSTNSNIELNPNTENSLPSVNQENIQQKQTPQIQDRDKLSASRDKGVGVRERSAVERGTVNSFDEGGKGSVEARQAWREKIQKSATAIAIAARKAQRQINSRRQSTVQHPSTQVRSQEHAQTHAQTQAKAHVHAHTTKLNVEAQTESHEKRVPLAESRSQKQIDTIEQSKFQQAVTLDRSQARAQATKLNGEIQARSTRSVHHASPVLKPSASMRRSGTGASPSSSAVVDKVDESLAKALDMLERLSDDDRQRMAGNSEVIMESIVRMVDEYGCGAADDGRRDGQRKQGGNGEGSGDGGGSSGASHRQMFAGDGEVDIEAISAQVLAKMAAGE